MAFHGGWDLAELVAAERWRFILNLVEHLPPHSNYVAALGDDDELAEQQTGEAKIRPPRLTEWTPEVQAIASAVDRLGELIRAQIASGGKKPPKIPRYPRPVTAAERVKRRRKESAHLDLVGRVLPHKREADI